MKTYRITILDDADGVELVSFVDRPAIERNLISFNAYQKRQKVSFNEEMGIVTTPVLIPDLPIYRNQDGDEYYLIALPEDVRAIYTKFMKDNNGNKLNLMHQKGTELTVKDAFLLEVFLSDEKRGISAPRDFADLPNNTWFASYKIEGEQLKKDIKDGKINGVSIDGFLGIVDFQKDDTELQTILTELTELKKLIK